MSARTLTNHINALVFLHKRNMRAHDGPSPHTEWMDECVPEMMDRGKDQDQAVAICLHMWDDSQPEPSNEDKPDVYPDLEHLRPGDDPQDVDLKAYDESQHPRDEHGRWTDAGGGDEKPSASPSDSAGAGKGHPTKAQVDTWRRQIDNRQAKLQIGGQLGGREDDQLEQMKGALARYALALEDKEKGDEGQVKYQLHTVEDKNGKLQAAASLAYFPRVNAASISFAGGLNHDALVRVLNDSTENTDAIRIDGHCFTDDKETMAAYDEAGFRDVEQSGASTYWRYGVDETPQQRDIAEAAKQKHTNMVRSTADAVAKDLGFPADKIAIVTAAEPEQDFVINGRQFKAAGLAYTRSKDPALKGTIKLYTNEIGSEDAAKGISAHEIEHIKFQTALDRYRQEFAAVVAEPKSPDRVDEIMRPDGSLKPPYDQKYPVYTIMHDAFHAYESRYFAEADGVSDYSYEYWKGYKAQTVSFESAVHETLAEMARTKYTTGKFPDHMGERIISYRGEDKPKPSQAVMDANAKRWHDLYRAVEKVYKL